MDGLPATLARERLLLSRPGYLGEFTARGTLVGQVPVPGTGTPRFVAHGSTVAFASGGSVFIDDLGHPEHPARLSGTAVFSGPHGSIGVVGSDGKVRNVDYVDAGGHRVDESTAPEGLPAGVSALAGLPAGVLGAFPVVAPTAFVDFEPAVRLGLYTTGPVLGIGTVSAVVAVSDRAIATVACSGDGSDCHLAVVDPENRRSRLIAFPAGYRAFAPVEGAFSPDGRTLAAFVISPGADGDSDVRAMLIDVATGRAQPAGPALPVAALSTQAAWSGDGRWLYFQVTGGPVLAQEVRKGEPYGSVWPLRLTVSGQLAGV